MKSITQLIPIVLFFCIQSPSIAMDNTGSDTAPDISKTAISSKISKTDPRLSPADNPGDTVSLDIAALETTPSDTVCVPVTVQNFDSILGMQFTLLWNPLKFQFKHLKSAHINISDSLFTSNNIHKGILLLSWINENGSAGMSVPDGDTLMELCFVAKGSPGDTSTIAIADSPLRIEIIQEPLRGIVPHKTSNGFLQVDPPDTLYADYSSCPSPVGAGEGTFSLSVYSGTSPYTIDWKHSGQPAITGTDTIAHAGGSSSFSGLPPTPDSSYYEVTITDELNTTTHLGVEIDSLVPSIDLGVLNNCPDPGNAKIGIDSLHVREPYSLKWSTGQYNAPAISQLNAGSYALTLIDGYGCRTTDSFDLNFKDLSLDYSTVEDNTCEGTSDGSITVKANRGHPDEMGRYTYRWSNGEIHFDTASTLTGLSDDSYWVTISDGRNCRETKRFNIDNKQSVEIEELVVHPVSCHGGTDGSIAFSVFMDGGPVDSSYIFDWSSDIPHTNTGDSVHTGQNLTAGTYDVTVSDDSTQSTCRQEYSFTVEEPDSLYYTMSTTPEEDSMMNGSIDLEVFGGTPPYATEWYRQGEQIHPQLDSLEAGIYIFKLTDDNGCMLADTIEVEDFATFSHDPKSASQWKIYPNPADQRLHLECNRCTDRIVRWSLTDLEETIHRGEAYDQGVHPKLNISVESLAPGVYFLQWTLADGTTRSGKVVIY